MAARLNPHLVRRDAACLVALLGFGTLPPTLWVDGLAAGSLRAVTDVPHTATSPPAGCPTSAS